MLMLAETTNLSDVQSTVLHEEVYGAKNVTIDNEATRTVGVETHVDSLSGLDFNSAIEVVRYRKPVRFGQFLIH